jgi:tetratricopeptide (TPR) repeat protein
MKGYLILFLWIGYLFANHALAQNSQIDSLKQLLPSADGNEKLLLLDQIAHTYSSGSLNLDSSLFYTNQLESYARKINERIWIGKANAQKASVYFKESKYDSVIIYANSAIVLFESVDSLKLSLWPLRILGFALVNSGQHEKAMGQSIKALQIADSLNDVAQQIIFLDNIGASYRLQGDGEKAAYYLEQAHALVMNTEKEKHLRPKIIHNLALTYDLIDKEKEAIDLFKSLFINYGYMFRAKDSSRLFTNIARIYIKLNSYDSAKKYLDAGEHLRKKLNNPSHSAFAYKEYATLYRDIGQIEKSIDYGKKVLAIGEETGETHHVEDAYRNLSETFFAAGKYRSSAEYYIKYIELLTEMFHQEKQEMIVEMDTKYQTVQKEKEIKQLEAQKEIDDKERSLLIGGIIFIGVIAVLVIFLLKTAFDKQKAAKKLAVTQLSLKEQELGSFVKILQEKNKILEQLENQLATSSVSEEYRITTIDKLTKSIILTEQDWDEFKVLFEEAHGNFFTKLKLEKPDITSSEMRIAALIKLNLSTKEIAHMLGISPDSVTKTKYRIKKKFDIEKGKELEDFVASI